MADSASIHACATFTSCVLGLFASAWNTIYTVDAWAPRFLLNMLFRGTIPPPAVAKYMDALCSDCTMLGQLKLRWETAPIYMFMDIVVTLVGCAFVVAWIVACVSECWWPPIHARAAVIRERAPRPFYPMDREQSRRT